MALDEQRFRKWMVTLAAASLLLAFIRLWIGQQAEIEKPRRVAALRGRFFGDNTENTFRLLQ
ncbi:MAG: hypothetical protein HOY44_11835 [Maritimibacter sp.]|uniref:hypothetical protein n=1 Tax=Maritimibacter sp. TaxID=2003363 RepID=UPI001D454D68|nr:hypothetical protein [Maritimibacter sp.]MBL6428211.1 hypothetical protein [Maritimibacter sp.]